ncbi:hypothetical protein ACHAW5_005022 [Stephanodiscus triporus]|uniref:Ammonium transporter n=1 Tax=Stephanodiscus triporus TaxID=2934178 RepID=A0ABD3QAF0_9STRA
MCSSLYVVILRQFNHLRRQSFILECIANSLDATNVSVDTFFLIYAASLVFYMQTGFAMLCAGSVRIKNLQNTMLKNILDACGASLGFYTVGFAFAFGGNGDSEGETTFIGTENFFLMGVEQKAVWLFQFSFAATSATIVAGTLAERSQMLAYLCYSAAMTAFVYPVAAHSIWNSAGFLSPYNVDPFLGTGTVDFAGCLVVHITGGLTALIAAKILGPRKGRFYQVDGKITVNDFPGHSIALKALGVFILWFCWYGFNTGSVYHITGEGAATLAQNAAVNTTLAAASGAISALFARVWISERETGEPVFSLCDTLMGCLSGLVSITGGCAFVPAWASIVIGLISGVVYLSGSRLMIRFGIDDAVDAIPIHMLNGMWGCIAVGLFADPAYLVLSHPEMSSAGLFYSNGNLLVCQIVGIFFVFGWVTITMTPFFCVLHYAGWLRADSLEEIVGLDISYHGGFRQRGVETESNHDEEESLYYQRREELREKQRNKIRRRILMMDISLSRGRNSVASASEEKSDDVGNHDDDQGLPPIGRLTI